MEIIMIIILVFVAIFVMCIAIDVSQMRTTFDKVYKDTPSTYLEFVEKYSKSFEEFIKSEKEK
jgi:hypothetical protein